MLFNSCEFALFFPTYRLKNGTAARPTWTHTRKVPQDTFSVGTLGGGPHRPEPRVGLASLHERKPPIMAADLLNDRPLPFVEAHGIHPRPGAHGHGGRSLWLSDADEGG